MPVARRDALQRCDHEPKTARGIEVVGAPVQPVDEMVTKGFQAMTVAGQVSQSPDGAVPIVVTRELGCRISQVLDCRHVTSAPSSYTVNLPKSASAANERGPASISSFLEPGRGRKFGSAGSIRDHAHAGCEQPALAAS
jgi:hypothetical protein